MDTYPFVYWAHNHVDLWANARFQSDFLFDKEHENLLDKVLEQSLKEVNEGKVIPHEVAMKQAAQLLSDRPE